MMLKSITTKNPPSRNILPLVVNAGTDKNYLSTEYIMTEDTNVMRNYGNLLNDLCSVVPDGLVGFFPNFEIMEDYIVRWK